MTSSPTRQRLRPTPPDPAVLLANLPSAVLTLDSGLRIVSANPAGEQLLSTSINVLEGRPLQDFVAPHAKLIDLIRQAQRAGSSISDYGVELALARGEVVSVDCHLTALVELPEHILVVLHPCSVARRLDQHLASRSSSRSTAALARTLAHEVKNPLSGIRGAAQLLEPYVGDEDKPLVKLICDEADRIVQLVDRMEEFAETSTVDRSPVNIHQVLEHVRRIAEAGFARSHTIVEQYDPSLPSVDGDRDKLIQVFLNLIKNAAEATPAEGGQITLVTHYQHGIRMSLSNSRERLDLPIAVEIRDNGPGIDEDLREHLFEPFVTTKPKGSGLGLPLVAKIVGDHGGIVSYIHGEPGAVFRVRLPAARSDRASGRDH
ncbi:MAG TPA: ATP-binding protein [Geminicoccaceae bacterium]|nr:ATP-binding protein [Geminicoccus sp.]HMU50044.1 ATP-binding protein [Geminicoccaceae bacterium]